jgi:hypothetical protein
MSKIKLTNQSAPDTPSSGKTEIYVDSSTKIISSKDDSGNVVPYFISDGWIPSNQTWTYASSTTITVPSSAASIYSVGDKIKFTQTTVKYFYIVAVADTLLTLTGGTDYTVTNATISSKYYSKMVSPVGFPAEFNCASPVWDTGYIDNGTPGQQPTAGTSKFSCSGRILRLRVGLGSSNVVKNGAGVVFQLAPPVGLPAITDTVGGCIGSAYWGDDFPGVVTLVNSTTIKTLSVHSIGDNISLAYSGLLISYTF